MGFVANVFGGGAARHAANEANVTAQTQANLEQNTGNQLAANETATANNAANTLTGQAAGQFNYLTGLIPGVTSAFQPTIQAGQAAANTYQNDLGYLTTPFQPTMAQLQATPGYNFTLQQGLESAQNSAAARGLGTSGAALKAAANYATGLAQNTYAQDAGIYQTGQQITANNLLGGMNAGTTAGNASGSLASGLANAASGAYMGGATNAANLRLEGATQAGNFQQAGVGSAAAARISGQNEAASGQLAYNNALASGINILANGINQGVGIYSSKPTGSGSGGSSALPSYTPGANALTSQPPTYAQATAGVPLAQAPTNMQQTTGFFSTGNQLVMPGVY